MMSNKIDELYAQLEENSERIENANNETEYSKLVDERKKIIKELNDRGEVILDDIGIAATPIFEEN